MHSMLIPQQINPPGIRPIKKREMWKKFCPVVPEVYHSLDIYQRPIPEELEGLKNEQAKKAREKKKAIESAKSAIAEEAEQARKRKLDAEANVSV